ncbi:MAG: hypothetical protein AB8B55_09565 [Mariniblastus sp.]
MSTWLSEKEFRQSGGESVGVTINVAFLQEIKTDFGFRDLLNKAHGQLTSIDSISINSENPTEADTAKPQQVVNLLGDLRDELKTYFALEEFYGYFSKSSTNNPSVSQKAKRLQTEHEGLFLELNELVELAEQILYREMTDVSLSSIAGRFKDFCNHFAHHEQNEMDLMMRLCNEELGVGD